MRKAQVCDRTQGDFFLKREEHEVSDWALWELWKEKANEQLIGFLGFLNRARRAEVVYQKFLFDPAYPWLPNGAKRTLAELKNCVVHVSRIEDVFKNVEGEAPMITLEMAATVPGVRLGETVKVNLYLQEEVWRGI
jgi:hypothetical protein